MDTSYDFLPVTDVPQGWFVRFAYIADGTLIALAAHPEQPPRCVVASDADKPFSEWPELCYDEPNTDQ